MSKSTAKAKVAYRLQGGNCAYCSEPMQPRKWAYSLLIPVEIGGLEDGPGLACCASCLALKGVGDGLTVLKGEPSWEFSKARKDAIRSVYHHPVAVPYSGSMRRVVAALEKRWKYPRFRLDAAQNEDGSWLVSWPKQPGNGEVKLLLKSYLGACGHISNRDFQNIKSALFERNVWIPALPHFSHFKELKQPKHERKTFTINDSKKYLRAVRNPYLSDMELLEARIQYLKAKIRQ